MAGPCVVSSWCYNSIRSFGAGDPAVLVGMLLVVSSRSSSILCNLTLLFFVRTCKPWFIHNFLYPFHIGYSQIATPIPLKLMRFQLQVIDIVEKGSPLNAKIVFCLLIIQVLSAFILTSLSFSFSWLVSHDSPPFQMGIRRFIV